MVDRARARESARERTLLSAARLLRPQVFDSLVAARQPRKRRTYAPLLAALSAEAEAAAAAEGAAVVPQAAARAAAALRVYKDSQSEQARPRPAPRAEWRRPNPPC
jgi:hypothetical protein